MTQPLDFFNLFAVDEKASEDGVWVDFDDNTRFLIARAGNKKFRQVASSLFERNRHMLNRKDEAAETKAVDILVEAMSKGILLGWEGPVMYQGKKLEYSVESAKTLLKLEPFRRWVTDQSEAEALFKAVQDKEDVKN